VKRSLRKLVRRIGISWISAICLMNVAYADGETLASTPLMGWNSWDSYGTDVREDQVKANADVMAQKLANFGWKYVVVDIEWYAPTAEGHEYKEGASLSMDAYGRLTPAENRFPSARNGAGFKPLADYVHARGLKFGIHIMRGIPREAVEKNLPILGSRYHAADIADKVHICPWNPDMYGIDMSKPGAQEYYESIANLYASWGVDFIKADDMRPYDQRQPEYTALSAAIHKTGRPIVLSLSPGPAPVPFAAVLEQQAQMWRISDDFWDNWKLLLKQFDYARDWAPYIGKDNTWPDADMLPLGSIRVHNSPSSQKPNHTLFSADEQQTLMTLWSIFRSPLIFGGDLPTTDAATFALLTNPEVLAVDQHSRENRQVLDRSGVRVWTAESEDGHIHYVAAFNVSESSQKINLLWDELGMKLSRANVRDLWSRSSLGIEEQLSATLRPHASLFYAISSAKDVRKENGDDN
jgi:alpha-galactosidase